MLDMQQKKSGQHEGSHVDCVFHCWWMLLLQTSISFWFLNHLLFWHALKKLVPMFSAQAVEPNKEKWRNSTWEFLPQARCRTMPCFGHPVMAMATTWPVVEEFRGCVHPQTGPSPLSDPCLNFNEMEPSDWPLTAIADSNQHCSTHWTNDDNNCTATTNTTHQKCHSNWHKQLDVPPHCTMASIMIASNRHKLLCFWCWHWRRSQTAGGLWQSKDTHLSLVVQQLGVSIWDGALFVS